ncbi:hypothetical protein LCGC14_0383280 [marine sediment metagenome]|uniref:Uncharacterized protein n=1 Tax=marine sediment metagenome TaxID=412755 RepID=A0A0F9T7K2_9ZZZZ
MSEYTVGLEFNLPPKDIKRVADTLRKVSKEVDSIQESKDTQYAADIMDEIYTKMEEQHG